MAVRIGKFGMSWLQPAGQAADLLVEAGRAKGAGIAALGQGIGQGIQAFGQNRRAERVREQDLALREQSRQDALAERAADNARQDAEFSMRQDAWKVEVLTANRDKAAQEAQLLATAAQELGDPDIVQRAKAAESEAQRFGTALDTLLSSRMGVQGAAPVRGGGDGGGVQVGGKPMSQMTDAELNDLMGKSERGEVDYTYRGGATGDMGQGVGTNAPSAAPMPSASMVNDGGVMSGGAPAAPMASAPSMPQVDPRDPHVLAATAEAKMEKADRMLRNPKLGAAARNAYERLRLESAAQLGFAQSELARQEQTRRSADLKAQEESRMRVGAADDARAASQDAEAVASMQADLEKRGIKETLPADITTARTVYRDLVVTDPNSEMNARRKAEASKVRADNQKSLEALRQAGRKEMEDIRARNREPAAAEKAAQAAIDNQESVVGTLMKEYDLLKKLREKGLIAEDDEDLAAAYGNFAAAKAKYMGMVSGGAPATGAPAPASTASADPMSKAEAEYNALPDAEKTPEAAARIAAKYGIK